MSRLSPVPIPGKRRVQMFCQSGLPLLAFLGCAAMVVWLWNNDAGPNGTIGELAFRRVDVAAQSTGMLMPLRNGPLDEFTRVEQGSVIAELDSAPYRDRLNVLEAELAQIRREKDAIVASAEFENAKEASRIAVESVRLAEQVSEQVLDLEIRLLEASVAFNVAKLQFEDAERRYKVLEPYADVAYVRDTNGHIQVVEKEVPDGPKDDGSAKPGQVVPRVEMFELIGEIQVAEETYKKRKAQYEHIKQRGNALLDASGRLPHSPQTGRAEFESLVKVARDRLPLAPQTDVTRLLAPIEAQVAVKQTEIDEVNEQIKRLVVKAPFAGMVTKVFAQPGQAVQAGTPICTISSEKSDYVLSYVRQTSSLRPQLGMKALVRFRGSKEMIDGVIVKIGAQVEAVSPKQLFDPRTQEWGLPIAIEIHWPNDEKQQDLQPRPGEIVHVTVLPNAERDSQVVAAGDNIRLGDGTLVFASPE